MESLISWSKETPMEHLGWDNNNIPSIFRNASEITIPPTTTTIWSNYQYDNLSAGSHTDYSRIKSSKEELNESFLINSSFEQLQGDLNNVDRINEVVEMLAPAFDSMSNSLDLELLQQRQEAARLAADSFVSSHQHHHHQLVSFPATATATATASPKIALDSSGSPTEYFGTYQELCILASARNDDGAASVTFPSFRSDNICSNNNNNLSSSGNFSSSSEGSSQAESSKNRRNCKRKLDDRHSSEYLPLSTSSTSTERGGGFQIFFDKSPKSKKPRSEKESSLSSNIDFRQESSGKGYEPDTEAIAQVKEMIYRAAAMRPVSLVLEEAVEKPKRKNVKISSDPQTVAARHRRERISKRLRVLQKLVPGGSKMDTASMLDEAANYLKFLKSQVTALETLGSSSSNPSPFRFIQQQQQQQQQQAFPMQSTPLFAHHPNP